MFLFFDTSPALSMRYKINIHAYSHIYFIISISLRCDDVFHHFIVLTNSKFTLRCAYLSRFVRSRFTHRCVCVQLNLLCLRISKNEMINFRYATTFSVGGTTSVKADMVSGHRVLWNALLCACGRCQCGKQ